MVQQENVRWIYQIRMSPIRMVKGKIIKESKQTCITRRKNWINKRSLEREKGPGWKSIHREELKIFIWEWLYEDSFLSRLQPKQKIF